MIRAPRLDSIKNFNATNKSFPGSSSLSISRHRPIVFTDKNHHWNKEFNGNINKHQQKNIFNENVVVLTPTYRKVKFKRHHLKHHGQSMSTTNKPRRNRKRTTNITKFVPRILLSGEYRPLYYLYGPSVFHLKKIQVLPLSGSPQTNSNHRGSKRRKKIKLKNNNKKIKSNNITIISGIRDPRPSVSFDLIESEDFDILRNNIPKPNTAKHLRRSLPNFINANNSSVFQSPPNFRIQSSSFGKPAPKPSYHWTYNPNMTINLTNRYTIKPLSSFRVEPITNAPINRQTISSSSLSRTNGVSRTSLNQPNWISAFQPITRVVMVPRRTSTIASSIMTTTPVPITTSTVFEPFNYKMSINTLSLVSTTSTNRRNRSRNIKQQKRLNQADRCVEEKCRLPYCRCGSSKIPAGLKPKDIPQLVMITFDDSINDLNWDLYQEIFSKRYNPNGCPILGTFYVSHEWTDYSQVQNLYAAGHEIASHTITHSFGEKFSKEKWLNEVNGQREILHLYGGVKYDDVRGMRAPFLQPGGNNQYEMLFEANFTYDSSLPVFENNPPFWPYTFDYAINHECMIAPCPTNSFPGLWEVGMVMLIDHRGGRCSMVDACSHQSTEEEVFEDLLKNFNRHYHSNKAPFGLYFHSAWFNTQHFRRGFLRFIDHIATNKDVYFVTKWQLIQWMQHPTPISRLKSFHPFHCDYSDRQPCHHPMVCSTSFRDGPRYLKTCQKCPKSYPWVGKTGFNGKK